MTEYLSSTSGATATAVLALILLGCYIMIAHIGVQPSSLLINFVKKLGKVIGLSIHKREAKFSRDLEIGKINNKSKQYRLYRFLNDLIIDLKLKRRGVTPYEFMFLMLMVSALLSLIVGCLLFQNALMAVLSYPIVTAGVICTVYTRANVAHDLRIEAVIESENIICNNIEMGVVVAVRNSLEAMPMDVKSEYKDFLDNVEQKNFHIRTALLELNNNLGSIADEFISKCIMFEMEEEHGVAGIFKDVVEVNNIKTELRTDMKHKFEKVKLEFIVGTTTILVFLVGVIAIFPVVREFYFRNTIGQLILIVDALIIIAEFVYITYLRAQEL